VSPLVPVAHRIRSPDMLQVLALFLMVLFFILAIRWPSGAGSNEAWFGLAPTRIALLTLTALGYGAAEAAAPRARRLATAGALLLFVVASAPFDAASYAASYPAAPLWWSAAVPFLEVPAYFTMGVGLGRLAGRLRVHTFLALLVPLFMVALVWLDVRFGLDVFDPVTAAVHVSWPHAAVMLALAAVGGAVHLRPRGRELEPASPGGDAA